MIKKTLVPIIGSIRIIFTTARILTFLLFLGFFVASHTITALAAITSTAISAVAGSTSTVMGRSKTKTLDLTTQNTRLRADLDIEKRRASSLVAENARIRKVDAVTFRGRSTTVREATQEVLDRTMTRTTRSTLANVSSIPGESVPFYGIAIVLAATAYELKTACDNMIDLYDLQVALDPETARLDDRRAVCALQIPTKQEVWNGIKQSPQTAWKMSIATLESVTDGVKTIETPEFGGMWQRFTNWIGGRP
ncbi:MULTISPECIES: hypothetical protein [unclassified Marinovum]|uniref:hypothetical protein n=1 Tax=unclassified Marinovum TaxID=2647166 RepID=UPI0026E23AB5|nr:MULTISPECIES: hypothetical protein [unclassified Marinovum]